MTPAAAHHRVRLLRSQPGGAARGGGPGRARGGPAAPAPLDRPRPRGRARDRRDRAAAGVRRQRPAGGHARGRGAQLPQPICGGAGQLRRGLHDRRRRLADRARPGRRRRRGRGRGRRPRGSAPPAGAIAAHGRRRHAARSRDHPGARRRRARGGRGHAPGAGRRDAARQGGSTATSWRSQAAGSLRFICTARPAPGRCTTRSCRRSARARRASASGRPAPPPAI